MAGTSLIWDLLAVDHASPAFLKVAGAADKAAASTQRATTGLAASLTKVSKAGAVMSKKVTLPLLAIGAVSVAQAAKWQKSMTLIQTAGGETAAKASQLSAGLMKVATQTGTSLDALGEGIYTIAKAGAQKWSATEQLLVMKAAAEGAKAENVSLATATDALSTVMLDYHTKASKAVSVENQLIRASGLAKTSFGEFSASLSNVTPIAAATGLSFKEIGGAIATMTQHGVSAQQATENLRNLIFNLAGQNNVASAAMQQLGINTVDLAKNLGKRGLSGTIAIVDRALRSHTKNGLVVVSVHKAAALATSSLNKMLGTMGGKLQSQSQGLLHGKVAISDYTKYAKSMGGVAGASALQFLALYKNSLGFSNQLRAGKGTLTTTTQQYQKMLGGMTGAAVAMQIGGKYAKDNARNVREVGKAALEAGSDVLGWNKTQDTLAVKMDRAKTSLQVMSVEIGTALIPAVSKLTDIGSRAVHWFDGLSGTQKKVLGWSLGVMAALGPLMSLGTRLVLVGRGIGTFTAGVGGTLGKFAGASEATAGRITVAMRGMTSAMTGAAIGTAFGMLTRNSSDTAKTLSVLGSAAAGAALGFGAGGGVGALIGGLAGGLSSLVTSWTGEGDAAKAAAQRAVQSLSDQKVAADSLYASLQQVNGSYTKGNTVKNDTLEQLRSKKLLVPLTKGGLDPSSLLRITLGLNVGKRAYDQYATAISHLSATQVAALDAIDKGAGQGEREWELYNQAQGKTVVSSKLLAGGLKNLGKEFLNVREGFAGSKTVAAFSAAAVRNSAVLKENVAWLGKTAASELAHGKSVAAVTKEYAANKAALLNQLMVMGANGTVVQEMIGRYDKLTRPRMVQIATDAAEGRVRRLQARIDNLKQSHQPGVDAKIERLQAKLATAQSLVDRLKGKTISVNASGNAGSVLGSLLSQIETINSTPVHVNTSAGVIPTVGNAGVLGGKKHHATGGGVGDGYFTVGERGWELGYKRGGKVTIYDNKTSQKMTGMSRVPGFAGGTNPKSRTVGGIEYASARAAQNARSRKDQSAMQSAVSNISALLAAAHNIMSSASDLAAAAKALRTSAREQKLSATAQKEMARDSARLTALGRSRDSVRAQLGSRPTAATAYDKLGTAQQTYRDSRSSVASAVGAFDVTTAGVNAQVYSDQAAAPVSAGSILGQLKAAASKAKQFGSLLKTLIKKRLPRSLVEQLAQAGPAAYDQALALSAATPAELLGIKSAYSTLTGAGATAGTNVANAYYKSGVTAAQSLVNGLTAKDKKLDAAIDALGDRIVSRFERRLGIKQSPSLHRGHSGKSGGKSGDTHIHVHGIDDPKTFARRVETEQSRRALARV